MATIDLTAPGDARGVLFVHSCSRALAQHVEWALAGLLGVPVSMSWTPQPVLPGTVRSEFPWRGSVGTASRIASALLSFPGLRYEVTEEPSLEHEGERYAVTPTLGLFRATTGLNGDVQVGEERLRGLLARLSDGSEPDARAGIDALLGTAWDDELEAFRCAGEITAGVRWLTQVG